MKPSTNAATDWTQQKERGSLFLMRLMAWVSLNLGRRVARVLLYPASLYFFIAVPKARHASAEYLTRVLGRPATWRDGLRHLHTFASTTLDRIYLLNDRKQLFDLKTHNEDLVRKVNANAQGVLLLGAHLGSFEALRAAAHANHPNTPLALLMYEENAQKLGQLMAAINPAVTQEIIALGKFDSMLQVQSRIAQGAIIGMLADRTFRNDETSWLPFLGQPAPFPLGPFRLASLLRRPLLLMLGAYQGGNHYEIHFELLFDFSQTGLARQEAINAALAQYVSRLEHYCRTYPYNWFNFYDFWKSAHAPV
jgi:predicted LPLAT superfamily acyltransferase